MQPDHRHNYPAIFLGGCTLYGTICSIYGMPTKGSDLLLVFLLMPVIIFTLDLILFRYFVDQRVSRPNVFWI